MVVFVTPFCVVLVVVVFTAFPSTKRIVVDVDELVFPPPNEEDDDQLEEELEEGNVLSSIEKPNGGPNDPNDPNDPNEDSKEGSNGEDRNELEKNGELKAELKGDARPNESNEFPKKLAKKGSDSNTVLKISSGVEK